MSAARPLRTLDEAARHGFYLRVTCEPCNRKAILSASEMDYAFGRSRSISSLRFRCEVCGNRRLKKDLIDREFAFQANAIIWRPIRVKR